MTLSSLLDILTDHLLLTLGALLLLIIILALMVWRVKQKADDDRDALRRRQENLWQELDELRVSQNRPGSSQSAGPADVGREQFLVEKTTYQELWPLVWSLHDRIGVFLRTVDAGESPGESRLAARNAALETRAAMNRMRPFYGSDLDDLLLQFVDTEIQVHLAACQYLDNREGHDEALSTAEKSWDTYRAKSRQLYDEEARTILNQIMALMRRRMIRPDSD